MPRGNAKVVISADKPFVISFFKRKQQVKLKCHYNFINECGYTYEVNRTIHEATCRVDGMKWNNIVDIVKAGSFRVEVLKIVTLFAFVNCFMIE